jgi:chemotaxis protein MotB
MKMNKSDKYSKGYLTGVTLPLIIITTIVGVGSYIFYDEHKNNQAITLSNQKEKKDLKANLKQSQSSIDLLESRQRQLDNQNRSLNVQIDNHQQGTDNLNQRIFQLENSLAELKDEQSLVQSRNTVLESNQVEFGNELIAADDRSGMLETALIEEQTKLQLSMGNTEKLKNNMQKMIAQESIKFSEMEKKLNDQNRSLNEQIDNHQLGADSLNQRIFQLENNLTELRNEQTLVQDRNAVLEGNLVEFGNEIIEADNRSEMLETALTEEQTKLQLAMINTEKLKNDLQIMIAQESVKSSEMEKKLVDQVDNHQHGTDKLNRRIFQLENSLTELRNEQTLVQDRNAVLEGNLVEFGNEIIEADNRSEMLETALTEEQKKNQLAMENTIRLKNDMQQMIAQETDSLNQRIFQLENSLTELQDKQSLVQSRNAVLESNLVTSGNELIEADNRSRMLETALTEEQKKNQRAMENTVRLKNDMQQMIAKVSVQSNEMEKELGQRQAQQASLNSQIDTVSEEKQALLRELQKEQQRRLLIQNQVAQINQSIDNKTEALSNATQGFEQLQSTLDQIRVQKEREAAEFAALKKRLEQELNQTQVKVTQLKNQMRVINLSSEVLFNSGSAEIKPAGQKVLALIASTLNNYPNRQVFIEGHTDDIPMSQNSTYSSNWELSSARAISAVEILQENNQVSPERLKVVGHGEFKPVTSNETEEGRRLNRRIEIRLLPETAG